MKSYAVQWLGSRPDREAIARRVSPLTYVRTGQPPVIAIHGDADPTVPYSHSTRLLVALQAAQVDAQLVTFPAGRHGGFSRAENETAFAAIRAFLAKHGLKPAVP